MKEKKLASPTYIGKIGQQTGNKDTEYLREISKNWTYDQWQEYLSTIDKELDEELFENPDKIFEVSAQNYAEQVFSTVKDEPLKHLPKLKKALTKVLKNKLSPREYEVTWLIFWENYSQREVAEKLNISRMSVRILRGRALEKIASSLFQKKLKNTKAFKELDVL